MNTPIIIFVRKERLLGASGKRQRLKEVFYYTHKKPPLPAPIVKLLQPIYKRLGSSTLYEYKNNSIYYHIEYEASLSSTWRELKAVNALVLSSLVSKLEGHRVKILMVHRQSKCSAHCASKKPQKSPTAYRPKCLQNLI